MSWAGGPFTPLAGPEADAVVGEGSALVAFIAPAASPDVRIA
jgi:hypothetical protein